jgi:hypothetical protein
VEHGITFTFAVNSVAVANLAGHGVEDVVAEAADGVTVLLGKGDGTVGNPVFLDAGGTGAVASFAVGDFNGDGKLDIVTSNGAGYASATTLGFLAGNGDGTFKATQVMDIGEQANVLAVGDFGNGKLDLVMASNAATASVTVLRGNGDGTFATVPTFAATGLAYSMAAGDFNGDGKPDLVTAGAAGVNVFLNNGNGTFSPGPTLFTGFASNVVVGDFNGDGHLDVAAVTGPGTIDIFPGNGSGTFGTPTVIHVGSNYNITAMVVGNFIPGGLPDIAIAAQLSSGKIPGVVQVLVNDGNLTFKKAAAVAVGNDPEGLAVADFNGDGKLDLVTTAFPPNGLRVAEVLLGNGDGTFQAPFSTAVSGLSPVFVAVGDFNGDGKPDLVLVDYFDSDEDVIVLPGNGDGTFGKPLVLHFATPLGLAEPVVADFFGDGKQSIALTTGLGQITVLRGNGNGTFQAPVTYLSDFNGTQPDALVVADFNGDGKPDLAVSNSIAATISVLLNTSPAPATGTDATTTTLTADATSAVTGQQVTLTATATAATGTATGTVTFFDGTKRLGAVALDPNGQARLLVSFTPGTHFLTASFAGIEPFSPSKSAALTETVTKDATTTKLTAQVGTLGGGVELDVTVTPAAPGAGVPTGTVTFKEGSTVLGTATLVNGQAVLDLDTLPPGTHTVTAVYSGDPEFDGSLSNKVTFTI